jgi:hypothetical protein
VVKTTRITIETDSLEVLYRGKTSVAWCSTCCAEVDVLALTGGSLGNDIPSALLSGWLAAGMLHLQSRDREPAQICLKSLLQCFESEDARSHPGPNLTIPKTGEGR